MDIKMIMSDVDGTLLNSNGEVSKETKEAIIKAKEKGIIFGLATGRPIASVEKNMPYWGIEDIVDVVAGLNGAHIKDYILDKEEKSYMLEGQYIKEIIEHFIDMDVNFTVLQEGVLKTIREDRHIIGLSISDRLPIDVVDFDELLKEPQSKLVIICDKEDMKKVIKRSETFSNPAYYCMQTGDTLFEYMDPRISKPEGIQKIAQMHGFTLEEVLAFGDADNDQEMVRDVGVGVAMGNGSEKTKANANHITKTNDENGIKVFLEKYIL